MEDYKHYITGSICVITIAGLSYYMGLPNWINNKYQKAKMVLQLMDNIKETEKISSGGETFNVCDNDRSACIKYCVMGKDHKIYVPYSRKNIAPMSQYKAELLRKGGESIDITQQPGIPYVINASDLGGYAIRIINQENNRSHVYDNKTTPYYGTEIVDTE